MQLKGLNPYRLSPFKKTLITALFKRTYKQEGQGGRKKAKFTSEGCPKKIFVIPKTSVKNYHYHLKDHLGNVRTTFKTDTESDTEYIATMETENNTSETNAGFMNLGTRVAYGSANHTSGGNEAARFNSSAPVGPALSLKVMPGDVIDLEAYSYYEGGSFDGTVSTTAFLADLASAFGVSSSGGGESYESLDDFLTGLSALPGSVSSTTPDAYINYILFDDNFDEYQHGYNLVELTSGVINQVVLEDIVVPRSGYIFVYVSMQSNSNSYVYFDDLKVTHHYTDIVSKDDYYPFGLTFNSYSRPAATAQNFKFNGKEEINDLDLGWMDYGARIYMPDLGRWGAVDPLAEKYMGASSYHFAANNPILYIDNSGEDYSMYFDQDDDGNWSIRISATYYVKKGDDAAKKSAVEAVAIWNNKTGYALQVNNGDGDNSQIGVSFDLKVAVVGDPEAEKQKDIKGAKDAKTKDGSSNIYI